MAFHVLQKNREGGQQLAETLASAVAEVGLCQDCRTLTETVRCRLCANGKRDDGLLCVVESPADIVAIEQAAATAGATSSCMGGFRPLTAWVPRSLGWRNCWPRCGKGSRRK